jgi:hypothetical protein
LPASAASRGETGVARCDGLHGWKRALVRIVERTHPDCRKPLAPLSAFHPCHRSPLQRRRASIERPPFHPPG